MYTDLYTMNKGFTLIELIISIALTTIILSMLVSFFKFQYDAYYNFYDSTSNSDNLRFLSTVLETQIRATPIIYNVNDCIYLKDIESPEYFNTYSLSNQIVYKTKTDSNLDSIGLGSNSQMAWNIDSFTITLTDQGNINMKISSKYKGKIVALNKEVKVMGKVITIKN